MSTTTRSAPVPEAPVGDGGLRRLVGIVRGLMGTQAATAALGLVFWTLATRQFTAGAVGVAGAAVALMGLLASLGTLGLGTVLIARLPRTPQGRRRVLVRTSLAVAGALAALLAVVVPLVVVHLAGADNLRPVAGTPGPALLFALGTALMAAAMVLDQAVLVVGTGGLQLERNTLASAVKVLALVGLTAAGAGGGMSIFAAWTVGTLVSLPWVAFRSRGGRALQDEAGRRLVDLGALRGLGRLALSHHALNTTLQTPLLLLPLLVTVVVSAEANGVFTTAMQLTALVFALPFAISISLFAAADGDARAVVANMRRTLPFGLALSLAAYLAVFPLAPLLLSIFGEQYADQGVGVLRLLTLAGLPFVVKDHYVALMRVLGRTGRATAVLVGFLPLEVAAATAGALAGGTEGLVTGWLVVLLVEAVVLGSSMLRTVRALKTGARGADAPGDGTHEEGGSTMDGTATGLDPADLDPADPATPPVLGPDLSPLATGAGLLPADAAHHGRSAPGGPGGLVGLVGLETMVRSQSSREGSAPDPRPAGRAPRRPLGPVLAPVLAAGPVGPVLVAAAAGLLAMSLGARAGREQVVGAAPVALWVTGLLLIVVPAAWAVLSPRTPRAQRLVIAVAAPVVLQLSRTVLHPLAFAFHDELIHATVLRQVLDTGRLFSVNSLLPITGFYPGTEVVTAAVVSLTGLGQHAAAQVVLVAARVVLALAVIALVERVTGSTRIAATASVVYALNPQFLFFNSQYSYQTFALPMAVLAVHLVLTRRGPVGAWDVASAREEGQRRVGLAALRGAALPVATLAAVVLSHHVTTVLLVIALAAWAVVDRLRQGAAGQWRALAVFSALTAAGLGATLLVPGNTLATYLGAIAESSGQQVQDLLGTGKAKPLFANSAGISSQPWEQVMIVVAVLVTTAVTALALLRARAWWSRRRSVAVLLALVACLWPLTPAGHLTRATAEVGDRAAGFSFVGVALVVSWWLWTRRPGADDAPGVLVPDDPTAPGTPPVRDRLGISRLGAGLCAVVVGAVFLGSVVFGAGPLAGQLPGPFRVSADARSVDPYNLAAAAWLGENVPPGTRVYADRVGGLLAAADGGVFTVRNISTEIDASRLLLDPEFTDADLDLIERADVSYVVADRRNANGLPNQDVYVENGEFGQDGRTAPVPLAALRKLDAVRGAQRVYDNGAVAVYDVRSLR